MTTKPPTLGRELYNHVAQVLDLNEPLHHLAIESLAVACAAAEVGIPTPGLPQFLVMTISPHVLLGALTAHPDRGELLTLLSDDAGDDIHEAMERLCAALDDFCKLIDGADAGPDTLH